MADNRDLVRSVTGGVEKKYGLPEGILFKMAGQESSYTSDAMSPKGASGWFQFMPATAKAYGLADPTDLNQSADAAGRYMRDNMKRYKGNIRESLADYNGGPRAVAALRAGTPYAETAGYLKGILGESPGAEPARTFPVADSGSATFAPDASQLASVRATADGKSGLVDRVKSLPAAAAEGWKLDNSVYNYWQTQALENSGPPQPITDDHAKLVLEGVRSDHQDYILQGSNEQERWARRGRTLEAMKKEQELGEYGWAGMTGRLAAGMIDLPTLLAFVPIVGGAGVMTAAGRVSNAVRMGVVLGSSNAAFEAATYKNRPLGQEHDIYMAAAMGVGLGGLTGGLSNPRRFALHDDNQAMENLGRRIVNDGHLKEIESAGGVPDAAYRKFLGGLEAKKEAGLKEIDLGLRDWSIGQPRDVNVPVNAPGSFKGIRIPSEEPPAPKAPAEGTPWVPPVERPQAPSGGPRWESVAGSNRKLLILEGKTIPELREHMVKHTKNPELVAVLDRALQGIDLRKLDFQLIPKGGTWKGKGSNNAAMANAIGSAKGAVATPGNSVGDGIKMFLRDESWGPTRHGMQEETFVHELVHAAAVYKQHASLSSMAAGRTVDPAIRKSVMAIRDLHRHVVSAAEEAFGVNWKTELNNRLGVNLSNDKEFLAYGLTNEPFQAFLKTVKVPGSPNKSLWDNFVKALRGLLGMKPGDHNALTKLIELSSPVLKKGGVTREPRVTTDFVGDDLVTPDTIKAANDADLSVVFGIGLGLEHRLGSARVPQAAREEASKLFGSTVGYKNHSVVKSNAWDTVNQLADSWALKLRKDSYPAFESWFKESKRPNAEKGKAFEEFGTEVSNYVRGVDGDYPQHVKTAGEAIRKVLADTVDHINNPAQFRGGKKRGLTETVIKDENGVEKIVGTLEKNPNYLPRKHDITKWNQLTNQFGRESIEGWWARAYQSGREGITDEAAQKWAGWYVRSLEEAQVGRKQDLFGDLLQGMDRDELKNSLMRNGGYDNTGAEAVLRDMFPSRATDTGVLQSSLKHRNTINERYTETWKTPNGDDIKISLNDFTESNALHSVEGYLRRTAGSVSLADHMDVYRGSDIAKRIGDATPNTLGEDMMTGSKLDTIRKDLQFAYDRIQGIPQEDFTGLNKSMEMWRNFNVIRLMGGTVWNQATEMSQIVGSMGWNAMMKAMPELKALKRDIATGKAPHDILEHLENTIGGAGSDYVKRMEFKLSDDWVRNKGDTAWNRRLDKVDHKLKQFAKGTLDYTGMTPLMIQQKRVHAVALVNHFVADATGTKASTFLTKERLAWMGMDDAAFKAVQRSLKRYTSPAEGAYNKASHKIDFDAWVKKDPETHARFMEAIHRESRRVIQENDLASMIPIMGTTLGKTMFQFMNFSMHGWNKSLLFAAHHRDWSTLSTVLHGGMFASLAYMGRSMLTSVGMDEQQRLKFMEERMSAPQIVANSVGRISQASLLPNLYDSTLGNLTGPAFSGMRTTSDISSIASNPTLSAINSALSLMKAPRNAFDSEKQTTSGDIKKWGGLLPLNNVVPVSTLLNAIANDYPTSAIEE